MHILSYTCIYQQIRSFTNWCICTYLVRIWCTYMLVSLLVYARIARICTYARHAKVLGASLRANTCKTWRYCKIRTRYWPYTNKILANTYQIRTLFLGFKKVRIHFSMFILQVYVRISKYTVRIYLGIWKSTCIYVLGSYMYVYIVSVRICMFMHVYVRIWFIRFMLRMYMLVSVCIVSICTYCMYMYVSVCIVCMCTYVRICQYCTYMSVKVCICIYMYVCLYMYVLYVYVRICMYFSRAYN
jgi:hypothetical protein